MKYLIGKVMNLKFKALFFICFFSLSSWADITVPLPGVPLENENPVEKIKTKSKYNVFVPDIERNDLKIQTDEEATSIPDNISDAGLTKEITKRELLRSYGITIPGAQEDNSNYLRLTNRELLDRFQREGTYSFSFYYIKDEYDISDSKGIYQRTFGENVSKAMRGGSLHFSFDRYWMNRAVTIGWTASGGVGLSQGNGSFTSGGVTAEQSTTKFSLWTIPVDIGLIFEVPLGSWLKIGVSGGPSAMGLYQHRNDKENNESGKRIRQVSWGYHGRANLKISLSHFMPEQSVQNLKAYEMTKTYLTLEARVQDFSNFQDDLTITGSSLGLGFSFEYL